MAEARRSILARGVVGEGAGVVTVAAVIGAAFQIIADVARTGAGAAGAGIGVGAGDTVITARGVVGEGTGVVTVAGVIGADVGVVTGDG